MSDCKKPSVKGMANMGYLGHFAQDKFIQQGHNDSGSAFEDEYARRENSRKRMQIGDRMVDRHNDRTEKRLSQSDRDFQEVRAAKADRDLQGKGFEKPMEERLEERKRK